MKKKKTHSSHTSFFQSVIYVLLSIVISVLFIYVPVLHDSIASLGEWGYIGAVLAGMFVVSIFTAAPATIVLFLLVETHPILPLSILAGAGAMLGDFLILSVLSFQGKQVQVLLPKNDGIMKSIHILQHSKYRLFLSVVGAIIVASPIPDELGLALMGVGNESRTNIALITFILNTVGIYMLLTLI